MKRYTPREKFIIALEGGQPSGRLPHFELVFYLTMEAFGKVHPQHRCFSQWHQMSQRERESQIRDVAQLYIQIARQYEHSAIYIHPPYCEGCSGQELIRMIAADVRELSGDEFFLCAPGDATYSIPSGDEMMDFIGKISDDPQGVKDEAEKMVDAALAQGEKYRIRGGFDGFCLCADYCFNDNPFLSPGMFDEYVTPYLKRLISGYREMGFYAIKHTDGNIMPILDSLIETDPHALHSLDPQGGVDIAEVKRICGDKICLIGNVNCGLLQTGSEEEAAASARYSLKHGMPGGGYIFSTSNCIYTGLDLHRYEMILDIWRSKGNYPE